MCHSVGKRLNELGGGGGQELQGIRERRGQCELKE